MKVELSKIKAGTVVKANALIQESRFELSLRQQRIILYLISQIEMGDEDFQVYEFPISEFNRVCGLEKSGGSDYQVVKDAIKAIADKSIWIREDGRETLLRWIEKPSIDLRTGKVSIRFDNDMKPYLLQLKNNFTSYELVYTLHFRSKYSIRLYEYIKSIHYNETAPYEKRCEIDKLRSIMGAELYKTYRDFKRRVLELAVKEINLYSDKIVSFTEIKSGRKVVGIILKVSTKDAKARLELSGDL